jgi:hypothetical protein
MARRTDDPMRDRAVHYDYSADWTACGKPNESRLLSVEPPALTCRKCIARLNLSPGWRRDYRNW